MAKNSTGLIVATSVFATLGMTRKCPMTGKKYTHTVGHCKERKSGRKFKGVGVV